MKFVEIIIHNFWLKIISLVLAIATWFYVFDLINPSSFVQKKEPAEEVFVRYQFTIKEVPVRPVFIGRPPEGYRVVYEKVKVNPSTISIYGPIEIIQDVDELVTDKVDLSEQNRTMKLKRGLQSYEKLLKFKDKEVDVYVPIEKVPEE
jgi:YbbR domain-containing protein